MPGPDSRSYSCLLRLIVTSKPYGVLCQWNMTCANSSDANLSQTFCCELWYGVL